MLELALKIKEISKMLTTSKKADAYLKAKNKDLQTIFAKIKELDELNRKVSPFLEPTIRHHCQVANLVGSKLTLIATNGSIATQLYFQKTDLLKKFKHDPLLQKIRDIHCKVHPNVTHLSRHLQSSIKKVQPLSKETAEIVREIAETIEDPKLRKIMERIAKHTTSQHE